MDRGAAPVVRAHHTHLLNTVKEVSYVLLIDVHGVNVGREQQGCLHRLFEVSTAL
jgi:hypothetical protein